jgi:hypothetical protein
METGDLLPWWSDPRLLIAFWRPLSALTHLFDGAMWPRSPAMMHVHSLVWFVLLLGVVCRLYRRLAAPWLAHLSLLLYAIDDKHGATLTWIANRNAVVATVLGVLALLAHDRWRRESWGYGALVGPLCLAAGLLAGETAVAAIGYLLAYAAFVDPGRPRARAASLAPYALVVVAWRVVYTSLGYGARGSGVYLDPGREPLEFLRAAPARVAILLNGQFGAPGSDLAFWGAPAALPALVAVAVAVLAVVAWLLVPLLRARAISRFWALGTVLAAIPAASSVPGDRLLIFVGVGAMALVAELFAAFVGQLEGVPGPPLRGASAVPLLALFGRHVLLAPLLLPLRSRSMDAFAATTDAADDSIPRSPDLARQTLIIPNPPMSAMASYIDLIRITRGEPRPGRVRWLASATAPITLTRTSERVVRVRPRSGFMANWPDRLYRSPENPMRKGERVELSDVTIEVIDLTTDGRPAEAELRFHEPLESDAYRWMRWQGARYEPFRPPGVGETVVFPEIDFLKVLGDAFSADVLGVPARAGGGHG